MKLLDDINNLKGLREELRLQAHLFKKEVKDTFDDLENRWRELEPKLASIDKASIEELVERYRRVKKSAAERTQTIGLSRTLDRTFDDVLSDVKDALKEEGFGVLTQIDMQDTLKQKLDVRIPRYRTLGACNPALAYRALQADLAAGVMMPCNVVVYESGGRVIVCAIDPMQTAGAHAGHGVAEVAAEARTKLLRVLEKLNP